MFVLALTVVKNRTTVNACNGYGYYNTLIFTINKGISMKYHTIKSLRTLCLIPMLAFSFISIAHAETPIEKPMPMSVSHDDMHKDMMGSEDMKQSMKTGMDSIQNMEMSGDMDKDFATMMKIHHQQAVDMAKMELAHGKSQAMKAMAKKIITAQKKEIAEFDRWLEKQK